MVMEKQRMGIDSDDLNPAICSHHKQLSRRTLLRASGLGSLSWLSPVAELLAGQSEVESPRSKPRSMIVLWLAGGPSQLETFDPHPDSRIAGGTRAIQTNVPGIRVASGLEQIAEQMDNISLVRSMISREGDHERATYQVKTGFRPDPTLVHPSLGAVICHEISNPSFSIPRHVSILSSEWPARGGYLGDDLDAFVIYDPKQEIPDVQTRVSVSRQETRMKSLEFVERHFVRHRIKDLESKKTRHQATMRKALEMMHSDLLTAFDLGAVPQRELGEFGNTPFGRGCLVAAQLIEVGVRCVEVTLGGWDSHINNHGIQSDRVAILDPAFAALLRRLKSRDLLKDTVVLCGGEFGRTPSINPAGGRDHWPHGFSVALAGGGFRGGKVIGATDPEGSKSVERPIQVADLHATILNVLGIDFSRKVQTPVGRPVRLSPGKVIGDLITTLS